VGFRNELTAADALDTRGSSGGVLIDGPEATWFDGFGRTGSVVMNTPPGGGTGGTSFVVSGGDSLAPAPATLTLSEEGLPAAGYQSVATIRADTIRFSGAVGGNWQTCSNGSGAWTPFSVAYTPRARLAAGLVVLEGLQSLAAGQTFPAGSSSVAAILPAGLAPAVNVARPAVLLNPSGVYFAAAWLVIAAGSLNVTVVNTTASTLTAGYAWSLGCT
jgi:hypothetical protein